MPSFLVTTIYGAKHKKPIVELRMPRQPRDTPKDRIGLAQLSVEEARDLAMNLLQACESAIQDAFLVEYFQELGLDDSARGALLVAFRQRRHDRQDDLTG